MKLKLFTILSCALLWCAAVSAQSYSVRVTYNTNLRASYSLDARVVGSAAAGSTLTVTGSHDRWLMIDRGGRQVWMADWVPMTRVAGGNVPAGVDNCCFVDRQCATDQDWTAGYWAYQNNQCGAPTAITPSVTAPLSTPTTPATELNNCCQTGWHCSNDQDWQAGFYAYLRNQCANQGMEIEGPEAFVRPLQEALAIVRARAPRWLAYITDGLSKVRLDPNARRSAVNVWTRTWHVPPSRFEGWGDPVSVIGSLVHEACHINRYAAGLKTDELIGERACLEAQLNAAREVYPTGKEYYINWATNLLANIHLLEYQWWHS